MHNDWVGKYTSRGWVPIAIKPGGKQPKHGGWPKTTVEDTHLIEGGDNLGLLLGTPSRDLIDLDLDCPEARTMAGRFMPPTLRSGREASPSSHWWYHATSPVTSYVKFDDPLRAALGEADRSTLLEVRGNGRQTVVAPSTHVSGDTVRWENWDTDPADLDPDLIIDHATLLAVVSLLGRYWPRKGGRHTAALALAGTLCRYPRIREVPGLLMTMVESIVALGYDDEVEDRLTAARDTLSGWGSGRTTGVPSLKESYGSHRAAVSTSVEWLDARFPRDEEEDDDTTDEQLGAMPAPTDLAAIMRDGMPETDWLLKGLLVHGKLQFLAGPSGAGKSLMALWMSREVIREGGTVMYIDEENDILDVVTRCMWLGMTEEEVTSITYYSHPSVNILDPAMMQEVEQLASQHTLVIIDSFWDWMANVSFDPLSYQEVGITMKQVERLKRGGPTVLVLDHVPKKNSKDFVGAGTKKASMHAGHTVHIANEWDQTQGGNGSLWRVKGRGGEFAPELQFTVTVDPRAQRVDFIWPDL